MKRYETLEEFLADCMTADDAIRAAFDDPNPDDKGTYHPVCCGQETKCSGGIVGTDCAKCETCGAEIIMVLSPHVSPILLGRNCTHMPSKELWDKVGDRQWFVVQKSASKLVATA